MSVEDREREAQEDQEDQDDQPEILMMSSQAPAPASQVLLDEDAAWVGRIIDGRYKVVRSLGRGGMGVVLLARQQTIDREVVIKVLSRRLSQDAVARKRFEREAQSLSRLQHPNIVSLYDFGHDQGQPFIVMEYVPGQTLARYMRRRRRLSMRRFFPMAVQVLAAVGAAHREGWVHRDLKPDNIMVTPREGQPNQIKVLDFGLARMLDTDEEITKQHLMGTALYLSPEQIQGLKVDQRADVYALGILFYLVLSGRRPFPGRDDVSLMFQHLNTEPTPLAEVLPPDHDLSPRAIDFIHRCLAKRPEVRPRDATAMLRLFLEAAGTDEDNLPRLELAPGHEALEDPEDMPAVWVRELTEQGVADLQFLAASFDAALSVDESFDDGMAAFDDLFASTGQLKISLQPGQFDAFAPSTSKLHGEQAAQQPPEATPQAAVGAQAPARQAAPTPATPAPATPAPAVLPVAPVSPVPRPQALMPVTVAEGQHRRRTMILAGVLVVVALVALAIWSGVGRDQSAERRAATAQVLEQAERLIEQGRIGEATYMVDSVEGKAAEEPSLLLRVAGLREQLHTHQLLQQAAQKEQAGDLPGALELYRQILVRGAHPEAQRKVDELTAATAPAPDKAAPPRDEPSDGAQPAEQPEEQPDGEATDGEATDGEVPAAPSAGEGEQGAAPTKQEEARAARRSRRAQQARDKVAGANAEAKARKAIRWRPRNP